MELRRYLEIIKHRWWLIILGPLLAGAAAYAYNSLATPIYAASATLLVNQTSEPGSLQYNDVLTSERLTNTYAELVQRRPVLDDTIDGLGLNLTPEDLAKKVTVSAIEDTQLLRVSVRDADPDRAALIANEIAQAFIANNAEDLGGSGAVTVAEQAQVPDTPVSPRILLNTILAVIVGLGLAGALAFFLEYLDDTIKDPTGVEHHLGVPTLAEVSRFGRKLPKLTNADPSPRELVMARPKSVLAEAYRVLRTNIQFSSVDSPVRSILITSANPQEGKSTTCANLATAFAQAGRRVIVVDADLRRPSLHRLFGKGSEFGLTNQLLSKEDSARSYLQETTIPGLRLLAAGPIPPNPAELVGGPRMSRLISQLREEADLVVFDSPPLLAGADASLLAAAVDATVLVIDSQHTRRHAVQRAREVLTLANARILGAVLNKVTDTHGEYYYSADEPGAFEAAKRASPRRVPAEPAPAMRAVAVEPRASAQESPAIRAARHARAALEQRRNSPTQATAQINGTSRAPETKPPLPDKRTAAASRREQRSQPPIPNKVQRTPAQQAAPPPVARPQTAGVKPENGPRPTTATNGSVASDHTRSVARQHSTIDQGKPAPAAPRGRPPVQGVSGVLTIGGLTDFAALVTILEKLEERGLVVSAEIARFSASDADLHVTFPRPVSDDELRETLQQVTGRGVHNDNDRRFKLNGHDSQQTLPTRQADNPNGRREGMAGVAN